SRMKPPFGIGQIGKAFRNEITPGNFIFRTREFEQMEIEYFTTAEQADSDFTEWVEACWKWFIDLGIDADNLRRFDVPDSERAHYSAATIDLEYRFGFQSSAGGELMGIANRTDFDLGAHTDASGTKMQYFDQAEARLDHVGRVALVGGLVEVLHLGARGVRVGTKMQYFDQAANE